jgi:hypothetical protein
MSQIKEFLVPFKFLFSKKGIIQLFKELPDLLILSLILVFFWGVALSISLI